MRTVDYTDDKTLLADFRNGKKEAFEHIFSLYYLRLRAYALHFMPQETAEDIVQDCFAKIWENRQILNAVSLQSLLFTIVRNLCLNELKHLKIVDRYQLDYIEKQSKGEDLYHYDFKSPEMNYIHEELLTQINGMIDSLPPRCKDIFVMSRFQHKKNREIADVLGITISAVEKQIAKALNVMLKELRKSYPYDFCTLVVLILETIVVIHINE